MGNINFKSDAAHISPVFFNIIKNNSKSPNVNPPQPTSYDATDVLTIDTGIVNNNTRNTRTINIIWGNDN